MPLSGLEMLPIVTLTFFNIGNLVFFLSDLDGKSRMTGDCHSLSRESGYGSGRRFRGVIPLYLLDFYLSISIIIDLDLLILLLFSK
jgi:hypothetical protein